MVAKVTQAGDEFALPLPRELVDELGIDPSTPLQLRVQGKALIVSPADHAVDEPIDLEQALTEVRSRYATMLKRLA
ncbi:MAG: AbrB/MazE/SpoVT family DNA-binding domain-containing protein [Planctomycetota bacterium]